MWIECAAHSVDLVLEGRVTPQVLGHYALEQNDPSAKSCKMLIYMA